MGHNKQLGKNATIIFKPPASHWFSITTPLHNVYDPYYEPLQATDKSSCSTIIRLIIGNSQSLVFLLETSFHVGGLRASFMDPRQAGNSLAAMCDCWRHVACVFRLME